jgi:hypothetical protein
MDVFSFLGWTSALSVIIPGVILLALIRGVNVPSLRNMTILISLFGVIHGFYHISYLYGLSDVGALLDILSVIVLVILGLQYNQKITGMALLMLAIPDAATYFVPAGLIISLFLFGRLALKSKSLLSLQTQLSIFLIIWIAAELLRSLLVLNLIQASLQLQLIGFEIHTVAMVTFGAFLLLRFYTATSHASEDNVVKRLWQDKETKSDDESPRLETPKDTNFGGQ